MNGGLNVGGDVGVSESQAQEVHAQWDSYNNIAQMLAAMGFPTMSAPPIERPAVSEDDYKHIEGEDYARVMFRVNKWLEYSTQRVAEFKGRLLCVENELSDLSVSYIQQLRQYYKDHGLKKPNETELKDMVKVTPQYRALKQAEQNLTIVLERLKIEVATYEKYGQGLSRQLTMRGQDIELGFKGNRHSREAAAATR